MNCKQVPTSSVAIGDNIHDFSATIDNRSSISFCRAINHTAVSVANLGIDQMALPKYGNVSLVRHNMSSTLEMPPVNNFSVNVDNSCRPISSFISSSTTCHSPISPAPSNCPSSSQQLGVQSAVPLHPGVLQSGLFPNVDHPSSAMLCAAPTGARVQSIFSIAPDFQYGPTLTSSYEPGNLGGYGVSVGYDSRLANAASYLDGCPLKQSSNAAIGRLAEPTESKTVGSSRRRNVVSGDHGRRRSAAVNGTANNENVGVSAISATSESLKGDLSGTSVNIERLRNPFVNCPTPKHKYVGSSRESLPSTPAANSPDAASSTLDDMESSLSSPSWPRTPMSPSGSRLQPTVAGSRALSFGSSCSNLNTSSNGGGRRATRPGRSLTTVASMPSVDATVRHLIEQAVADDASATTAGDWPERRRFYERLAEFAATRYTPLTTLPAIAKVNVDLYRLYMAVQQHGGFDIVCKRKLWRQICPNLGIQQANSSSGQLKKLFACTLLEYVQFYDLGQELPPPNLNRPTFTIRRNRKPKVELTSTLSIVQPPCDQTTSTSLGSGGYSPASTSSVPPTRYASTASASERIINPFDDGPSSVVASDSTFCTDWATPTRKQPQVHHMQSSDPMDVVAPPNRYIVPNAQTPAVTPRLASEAKRHLSSQGFTMRNDTFSACASQCASTGSSMNADTNSLRHGRSNMIVEPQQLFNRNRPEEFIPQQQHIRSYTSSNLQQGQSVFSTSGNTTIRYCKDSQSALIYPDGNNLCDNRVANQPVVPSYSYSAPASRDMPMIRPLSSMQSQATAKSALPINNNPHNVVQCRSESLLASNVVEATKPKFKKRRKVLASDLIRFTPFHLSMALKSGLSLEALWAMNVLTVLLHDDATSGDILLSDHPALLYNLVALYRLSLTAAFPQFFKTLNAEMDKSSSTELSMFSEYKLAQCQHMSYVEEHANIFGTSPTSKVVENSDANDVLADDDASNFHMFKDKRRRKNYTMMARSGKRVKFEQVNRTSLDHFTKVSDRCVDLELKNIPRNFPSISQDSGEASDAKSDHSKLCAVNGLQIKNEPSSTKLHCDSPWSVFYNTRQPLLDESDSLIACVKDPLRAAEETLADMSSFPDAFEFCRCLSNIFRALSFIELNQVLLADHKDFVDLLSIVLTLCHEHTFDSEHERQRRQPKVPLFYDVVLAYDQPEPAKSVDAVPPPTESGYTTVQQSALRDRLADDTLTTLAQIACRLRLSSTDSPPPSRPVHSNVTIHRLLGSLAHWAVCRWPGAVEQSDDVVSNENNRRSPNRTARAILAILCATDIVEKGKAFALTHVSAHVNL